MTVAPEDRLLSEVAALRLRPLHIAIVVICGLGFMFDIADLNLSNVLSAVFSAPPHPEPPAKLALLLAAPYIGGVPGAMLFGWLADRQGRRTALLLILGLLGLTSLAAVWAHDIETLTYLRIASGFALGAFPPVVIAFLADHVPASRRGGLLMVTSALGLAGAPLSIFLIRGLGAAHPLGLEAWRWALLIYGIAALLVAVGLSFLPETVRFLVSAEKYDQADRVIAQLAAHRELALKTAPQPASARPIDGRGMSRWQYGLAALFNLVTPWATVAFPVLSGAILIQKGVKLPDALLYVGIAALAPVVGVLAGALGLDSWGRRPVLWAAGSIMLLSMLSFVLGSGATVLIGSGFVFQIAVSLFLPTTSIYFAEQFPTSIRARASGALWALNRLGSVVAPLVLLPMLHSRGPSALAVVIGASLLVAMGLLSIMLPGRARQELQ